MFPFPIMFAIRLPVIFPITLLIVFPILFPCGIPAPTMFHCRVSFRVRFDSCSGFYFYLEVNGFLAIPILFLIPFLIPFPISFPIVFPIP